MQEENDFRANSAAVYLENLKSISTILRNLKEHEDEANYIFRMYSTAISAQAFDDDEERKMLTFIYNEVRDLLAIVAIL